MQDFHLFEGLSALDNILLPARLAGAANAGRWNERANCWSRRAHAPRAEGRDHVARRNAARRRARALVRKPAVIIADEPTASLDSENGAQVADLIVTLAAREKSTLIVVSHDPALIDRFDNRIRLAGGRIAPADAQVAA